MRTILVLILLAALSPPAAWSQHGTIDADETLFTVLTAINLAGYDAEIDSPTNLPLRREIRDLLAARNLESVERLKRFYAAHDQHDWTRDLSQYISFALLVDGPPEFAFRRLTYELPPDAQSLEGLGGLLAEFYREAGIPALYQKIQPAIEKMATQYHEPVMQGLFEINGYLRNPTSGVSRRSFRVILSIMAAPNQVQTRSYSSNYAVVVSPSVKPHVTDVLYTYLHYVLEPVVGRAAKQLERIRPLGDYALGAPYLPEYYKRDFQLLVTSSLIKALQARLAHDRTAAERKAMVEEAYRRGYILTPYFAEQLPAYEKQSEAMRLYFAEMIEKLDLQVEENRARNLEFDQEAPVRKAATAPVKVVEPSVAEKQLEEAEELFRARDLEAARQAFLKVLRDNKQRSAGAKAYYGLARIATLNNDPELATSLFEKALEYGPEAREKSWILVYLGRLSDLSGSAEKAAAYYRESLAIDEASPKARKMAEQGAAGAFRRTNQP